MSTHSLTFLKAKWTGPRRDDDQPLKKALMLAALVWAAPTALAAADASPTPAESPTPIHAPQVNDPKSETDVRAVDDIHANSPHEALRAKIFASRLDKAACQALKVDPRGLFADVDADLSRFVQELIAAVRHKKELALQPLFHRRLNVALPAIAESFAKQEVLLGAPFDVSVHRLWALNTIDGSPRKLDCASDGLAVYPLYGYPLQFGLWLSVLGSKEIGRIYVGIVPADGRWNIGSFHFQQWTHAGKDAEAWTTQALAAASRQKRVAAFTELDIASKLLDGGGFLEISARADLDKARDAQMSREERDHAVRQALKEHDVVHVASLLVVDGAGLLLRVRVPGEIALDDIKRRCTQMCRELKKQPWSSELTGARCSFLMPREDPKKDGGLGGIYLNFAELES